MAKYGITYRGKHSSEFGLIAKVITKPAAPPVRVVEEIVPYRDGTVDYSESGGRLFYDDKVMEIEFKAIGSELSRTELLVSKAVNWLMGGFGDLILDSAPFTKWIAKPIDLSEIATEIYRVGSFTVQFRCKPFNQLIFDSLGPILDSDIHLDSDIALGYGNSFFVAESCEITLFANGDVETELDGIRINITAKTVSATVGFAVAVSIGDDVAILQIGADVSADLTGSKIFIDLTKKKVYLVTGEGKELDVTETAEFFRDVPKLHPKGYLAKINLPNYEGYLSFVYTPKYFYVNRELEANSDG